MATTKQESAFADEMIQYVDVNKKALENAVDWIGENLDPEDVFTDKKLESWAESNGYKKEE